MKRLVAVVLLSSLPWTPALGSRGRSPAQESDPVVIEYIAHACFRITSPAGRRVVVDPFASRVWIGYDFPDGIEADAFLVSHPHYDHDGGVARGHEPPWPDGSTVLREPGTQQIGDVRITGVAGKHADPYGMEFGQTNTVWLIEAGGLRIAHLGDNGPLTAEVVDGLGRVDVLMMPIDSEYHILKQDEIEAIREQLSPSILVPMHYRHPDLEAAPDQPEDLGEIDGWLDLQGRVRRVPGHRIGLFATTLPEEPEILVLQHSPAVEPPASGPEGPGGTRMIVSSEGWELIGDLQLPPGDERSPAALMLNQAAGDRTAYEQMARHLADRGIASLRLDLRGHGESTNLGRFVPGEQRPHTFIWDAEVDVVAAHEALRAHPRIDPDRIAIVGASYSGEEMAEAGRLQGYAQAYVALSPGSFSDESIAGIDASGVPWLFVASHDERPMQEITPAVLERSRDVELVVVPGTGHATDLLGRHAGLAERIAVWVARRLGAEP